MTDDVDEGQSFLVSNAIRYSSFFLACSAGWQYSLKFHDAVWHGNYKHFRSFVRRRRWIRLRHCKQVVLDKGRDDTPAVIAAANGVNVRKSVDVHDPRSTSIQPDETYDFMERFKHCRLDRERLAVLNEAMAMPSMREQLLSNVSTRRAGAPNEA